MQGESKFIENLKKKHGDNLVVIESFTDSNDLSKQIKEITKKGSCVIIIEDIDKKI